MSFNSALTAGQLTQLRRTHWQADQLISFCDNTVVLHATVASDINATPSATAAAIPYTGVISGSYTNIDEGMIVIVSPNSDMRNLLAVRLHVRYLKADASNIYVSEFSDPVSAGAHVWVLFAFDIIDNLSRPVVSGATITQKEQYDQAFQRMAPVICGLQTGYANWVNASGNYDIAFDASTSFAPESGATIASYAYSVTPTGSGAATVIAGSAATATVTYRFTYGEYWLKIVVTDSNGIVSFRHILVKAHDRTNYLPAVNFEGVEITRDITQGPSARIKAFGSVSTLLNGTLCIIWVDEQYSDDDFSNAAGSLINNIDMIGWVESEKNQYVTDPTYSAYAECSFEVQGVGARLMRLEGQMLDISYNSSPTLWDQINNLTPWRAIIHFLQRHTTALQLCSFALANMNADNTFLFPTIVTNAGRALDNVSGEQGIAYEVNAQLEFAADGRMQLARMEPYVATDLGHTPLVIATWDNRDHCGITDWQFSHIDQYGLSDADGAAWSGTVNVPVMPVRNRAPGLAQGSGPDQGKLNNQILSSTSSQIVAQAELAQRNGTLFKTLNNTTEITLAHQGQFHWLQPSFAQVYVLSFDTTSNIRGLTLDAGTNWMIKQVTVRHENKSGSRDVSAVYKPVVTGTPGANIPIVNPGETPFALPAIPPMPAFPGIEVPLVPELGWTPTQVSPSLLAAPTGTIARTDGNSLLVATATKVYWLTNFINLTTPTYKDVTPSDLGSFQVKAVAISSYLTNTAIPAYVLASDGTNSAVWYTPNVAAGAPVWTKGGLIAGVYTVLRATNVNGGILIENPNLGASSTTLNFDFTQNNGGWQYTPPGPSTWSPAPSYLAGQGWTTGLEITSGNVYFREVNIIYYLVGTVTAISMTFDLTLGGVDVTSDVERYIAIDGSIIASVPFSSASNGSNQTMSWSGSQAASSSVILRVNSSRKQDGPDAGGSALIKSASITYTPTGGSTVRYSSTNGATWGAEISAGSGAGTATGFDVAPASGVSYSAYSGGIAKASSLGGTYSPYYTITGGVQAAAVIVPWYNWAGTSQTAAANPDIIVALTGLDGSSRSLLWIEGGATPGTVHDLTPVAGIVFDHPNAVTVSYNHHIACFGNVSGVPKLYRTTDKGSTWSLIKTLSAPQWIRGRRRDTTAKTSGTNKGQLYMADGNMWWSSLWDPPSASAPWIRNMPTTPIIAADTVY
jgi:hypothetical protein